MPETKHLQYINLFLLANTGVKKGLLQSVHDNFIHFLGEIALNILSETISLSQYYKKKLQSSAMFIRAIASKKVKAKARRKLCIKNIAALSLMLKAVHSQLKNRFT